MAVTNLVPIWTASAPSIKEAAMPLPSPTPPAAITGIFTASATWGTKHMVVVEPIWPPDSIPSAITPSAPHRSIIFAMATLATTGITFTPASLNSFINLAGLPAPVVTMPTPSSSTTFATSGALGFISMMFTPTGLSVSSLAFLISLLTTSAGALAAAMIPSPPAADTAAAR